MIVTKKKRAPITAKAVNRLPSLTIAAVDDSRSILAAADADPAPSLQLVPLEQLQPNPFQPRMEFDVAKLEELADSLKTDGFLQLIVARQRGDLFEILDGERRRRAAELAGLRVLPVLVRDATDAEMAELAIVSNDCREELNAIERAKAYQRLLAGGMTQEQLGKRLGRSQSFVANAVRLLTLPEAIQNQIILRQISGSAARELVTAAKTPELLAAAYDELNTLIVPAAAGEQPTAPTVRQVAAAVRTAADRRAAYDRSAQRLDPAAVNEAALAAWQQRWLEELLMREIEHRGTAGMLKAIGVSLADAWRRGAPHLYELLDLFSRGELIDLADEWGALIDPSKPRDKIIRRLMSDPKIREKLPAILATA